MPLECRARTRGFSLLEALLAATIMAFALGALYTASARATSTAAKLERRTWAIEKAQSLLARFRQIPPGGVHIDDQQDATFHWRIDSTPLSSHNTKRWPLWRITTTVSWYEAGKVQQIELHNVRPQAPN